MIQCNFQFFKSETNFEHPIIHLESSFDEIIFMNFAEKIATILKASKVECESYWPSLFAKLAEKKNINDLIVNVGAGGGGGGAPAAAAPAAGGGAAAAAPPPEEKKEEPKEESDDDMGFSLFD
ncbi:putative ribosomal protein P1/P2 [Helianthus debilis subsp. tardiflorus]